MDAYLQQRLTMSDRIQVLQTDITTLHVDAIVNAANSSLLGGGGVDYAIHQAAGPGLLEECRTLNGCKTGQARLTHGYRLPAPYVIHTVGPIWLRGEHNEAEMLASCYRACFAIAQENSFKSLAFPAISCGIYGYPIEPATGIALRETRLALEENQSLESIIFACFDNKVFRSYQAALALGVLIFQRRLRQFAANNSRPWHDQLRLPTKTMTVQGQRPAQ